MRLRLIRFRCFDDRTFELGVQQFNLLKGPSGIGKSTLLEAVKWCFYGKTNHIYPSNTNSTTNAPTSVTISLDEYGGLILSRSKPPEVLIVSIPSTITNGEPQTLKGDSAQAYIISMFGTSQIWIMTSYIEQGERSILMTAPNSGKLELLQELTFGPTQKYTSSINDDVPEMYLDRIDADQARIKDAISHGTAKSNILSSNYTTKAKQSEWVTQYWTTQPTQTDLTSLHAKIIEYTDQINKLHKDLLIAKEAVGKATALKESYKNTELYLEKLTSELNHLYEDGLPTTCSELERRVSIYTALDNYEKVRSKEPVGSCSQESLAMSPDQLSRCIDLVYQISMEYKRSEEICKNETVEYSSEAVNALIQKAQLYLDDQTRLISLIQNNRRLIESHSQIDNSIQVAKKVYQQTYDQYLDFTKWWNENYPLISVSSCSESDTSSIVPLPTLTEIARLQQEVKTRTGESLKCPQCFAVLEFKQGRLYPCSMEPLSPQSVQVINEKLRLLATCLNQLPSLEQRIKDCETEKQKIDLPDPSFNNVQVLSPKDLDMIRTKIVGLRSIAFPQSKHQDLLQYIGQWSLQNIQKYIAELQIARERQRWMKDLSVYEEHLKQLGSWPLQGPCSSDNRWTITQTASTNYQEIIKQFQSRIRVISNLEGQINSQKATLARIDHDLNILPIMSSTTELESQIADLNLRKSETEIRYQAGQLLQSLQIQAFEVEAQREILTGLYTEQRALERLKLLVGEVVNHALQELVDSINITTNQIITELFDEQIQVELKLFKELKTKDRTKSQVNMEIVYKGFIYNTPNDLSGGERDRLSLALTLSLARVGNSPVLFLDECFSSLDAALREACIKVIKRYLPHKTIVNICHETIEGYYDRVVHVGI
jgi:DNA repair exonuclease SbcCD ATPase subunit